MLGEAGTARDTDADSKSEPGSPRSEQEPEESTWVADELTRVQAFQVTAASNRAQAALDLSGPAESPSLPSAAALLDVNGVR